MEIKSRKAVFAGKWYSKDPTKLKEDISKFLTEAERIPEYESLKSIIVPHAGYYFTGAMSGLSYVNIDPAKFNRVVLLGPSHPTFIQGIAITTATNYETPIGDISIDVEEVKKLSKIEGFHEISLEIDEAEHSIEMQCPFLRYIFGEKDFKLIPLIVGKTNLEQDRKYAEILAEYYAQPETLFVISTDFCHWGVQFRFIYHDSSKYKYVYESIESLDRIGMDIIQGISADNFNKYLLKYNNSICGRRAISVLLTTIEEYLKLGKKKNCVIKFLKYENSSKIKDIRECSVAYAAGINTIN